MAPLWESTQAYASDIAAFYSEAAANAGAGTWGVKQHHWRSISSTTGGPAKMETFHMI